MMTTITATGTTTTIQNSNHNNNNNNNDNNIYDNNDQHTTELAMNAGYYSNLAT